MGMKAKAMKTVMKAKAMKTAMKAMKESVIAKGKLQKVMVFKGFYAKTVGGLAKGDMHKSKRGKIVSKKSTAAGKKAFKNISGWTKACQAAKRALGLKGFVAIGGKTAQG